MKKIAIVFKKTNREITNDGKIIVNHSEIINVGKFFENNTIHFKTSAGLQIKRLENLDPIMEIIDFDNICLKNLMYRWSKENKTNKPIQLEDFSEEMEIFKPSSSNFSIAVKRTEKCIFINPVY